MTDLRYRIAHPTDFSAASEPAFAHALKLAVLLGAELDILHVEAGGHARSAADHFPPVRQTLARWGLIAADAPREAVDRDVGVLVTKVDIRDQDASTGVQNFLERNGADLVVTGSHGREGIDRMLHGSVSEKIAALANAPVLVVPAAGRGFVDAATGAFLLERVLVPVAADPDPAHALDVLERLAAGLQLASAALDFIHIGAHPPIIHFGGETRPRPVRVVDGVLVDAIIAAAAEADLIVMPTRKRDSLLDALRGTNTERVTRHAPCPVLAIPA